jgi:glycosyltransferase involved in cell wall biosynthesis
MIQCDHMTLVKMLLMIMDKIKVSKKPTLYEHPNCTCLNLWVFYTFMFCYIRELHEKNKNINALTKHLIVFCSMFFWGLFHEIIFTKSCHVYPFLNTNVFTINIKPKC